MIQVEEPISHIQYSYDDQRIYYAQNDNFVHSVILTNVVNKTIQTTSTKIKQCFLDANCEKIIYINSNNQMVSTVIDDEVAEEKLVHETA